MVKLIVLACSALLVLHCAFNVQGADPCVLDGFDLTELERYVIMMQFLPIILTLLCTK